jgi:hypothetical protein
MPCDSIVLISVMHKYNSHLNGPLILCKYVSPHSSSVSGVSELEANIYSFHLQILANFSLSQQVLTASFIKNHCHSQLQTTCMTFCPEKNCYILCFSISLHCKQFSIYVFPRKIIQASILISTTYFQNRNIMFCREL